MVGIRGRHASGVAIAAVLSLAACSERTATDAAAPPETTSVQPAAGQPPQPPAASAPSDGSAIQLFALSSTDLQANALAGELGCSFSTDTATPLLVAMGNVASSDLAQGLVNVSGSVERVTAPGGFDAMLKGVVFTGAGKTIRIVVTGPATGGGEAPPRPATLTYERADGVSRGFAGRWECGP